MLRVKAPRNPKTSLSRYKTTLTPLVNFCTLKNSGVENLRSVSKSSTISGPVEPKSIFTRELEFTFTKLELLGLNFKVFFISPKLSGLKNKVLSASNSSIKQQSIFKISLIEFTTCAS